MTGNADDRTRAPFGQRAVTVADGGVFIQSVNHSAFSVGGSAHITNTVHHGGTGTGAPGPAELLEAVRELRAALVRLPRSADRAALDAELDEAGRAHRAGGLTGGRVPGRRPPVEPAVAALGMGRGTPAAPAAAAVRQTRPVLAGRGRRPGVEGPAPGGRRGRRPGGSAVAGCFVLSGPDAKAPEAPPSASGTRDPASGAYASPSTSPSARPSYGSSPDASPDPGTSASPSAAQGHTVVHDEDGFSVAVPAGWERSRSENGNGSFYRRPGDRSTLLQLFRVTEPADVGACALLRISSANLSTNDGYREVSRRRRDDGARPPDGGPGLLQTGLTVTPPCTCPACSARAPGGW
ncbi:hypothetical protein [Streptomyces sp. NPDC046685]|uniref:hypothetical protein n=1 Tax=Streptomyces sp. NPDC046685 TaxID=3157202 RepID=UPI0033E7D3FB